MATATKRPPKKAAKKKPAASATNGAPVVKERKDVPIERIVPSPFQQRKEFPKAKVAELAESIRSYGLLQPLIVRQKPGYRTPLAKADWELIAGECRWRACQSLGHHEIRVEVWDVDDPTCRAMVAQENLKRNALNAIEEARTFQQAIDAGDAPGPTELAKQYNVSQGHVSNRLGLLRLPATVQAKVISHEIAPTQARHLVPLAGHPQLLDAVLKEFAEELKRAKKWGDGTISVNEFRDMVQDVVHRSTHPLHTNPWSKKLRRQLPPLKLSDADREALEILTIPAENGRKAAELVTNVDLLKKLRDEQERKAVERAQKREAKDQKPTAKGKTNGKVRKISAAAQKRLDEEARDRSKRQAEQFRRRLWAWYIDWQRWILARWIRDEATTDQLLLVLLGLGGEWAISTHRDGRMWQFNGSLCLTESLRAAKAGTGRNAIAELGAAGEDIYQVAVEFVARCFHDPDDGPSSLVPDHDVVTLIKLWELPIENDWLERQAGPHSEAYWNLHTKDQLVDLAKELKVKAPAGAKKPDLVRAFLAKIPRDEDMECGIAMPRELKKIKRPRGV